MPAGNVKLVLDGMTATGTPAGCYFPEMVMDLTIKPGRVNTVMGSMGSRQQTIALADVLGVYLPRLQSAILQPVSNTSIAEARMIHMELARDSVAASWIEIKL